MDAALVVTSCLASVVIFGPCPIIATSTMENKEIITDRQERGGSLGITPGVASTPEDDNRCRCGFILVDPSRNTSTGQIPVEQHEFPWNVHLIHSGCGGTIINQLWVVTAAHCVNGTDPKDIEVIVSDHDRSKDDGEKTVKVRRNFVHPDQDKGADIALLLLDKPLRFGKKIRAICLPPNIHTTYNGVRTVASGWGTKVPSDGERVQILQKLDNLKVIPHSECKGAVCQAVTLNNFRLCAMNSKNDSLIGGGVCTANSGGSLAVKDPSKERYFLIGIAQSTISTCDDHRSRPDIYLRITSVMGWMRATMGRLPCTVLDTLKVSPNDEKDQNNQGDACGGTTPMATVVLSHNSKGEIEAKTPAGVLGKDVTAAMELSNKEQTTEMSLNKKLSPSEKETKKPLVDQDRSSSNISSSAKERWKKYGHVWKAKET